jgi:beta-lactamase class A
MNHDGPQRALDVDVHALLSQWEREASAVPGTVSALLRTLDGPVAHRHADAPHYAASTVKLAVVIAVLGEIAAGRLNLATELEIRATFASDAGGLFAIRRADDQDDATWRRVGERVPVATLLERIVTDSSNIATNVMMEEIGFTPVRRTI